MPPARKDESSSPGIRWFFAHTSNQVHLVTHLWGTPPTTYLLRHHDCLDAALRELLKQRPHHHRFTSPLPPPTAWRGPYQGGQQAGLQAQTLALGDAGGSMRSPCCLDGRIKGQEAPKLRPRASCQHPWEGHVNPESYLRVQFFSCTLRCCFKPLGNYLKEIEVWCRCKRGCPSPDLPSGNQIGRAPHFHFRSAQLYSAFSRCPQIPNT
jgi:hypothetical protein